MSHFDQRPFQEDSPVPFEQSHAEAMEALRETRAFFIVTLDETHGLRDFRLQCTVEGSAYETYQLVKAARGYTDTLLETLEDSGEQSNT